jgi:hypothetical protein
MTIDAAIKEAAGKAVILRTCWECNSAHEHLRSANYPLLCFACGKTYWKGVCIHQEDVGPDVRLSDTVNVTITVTAEKEEVSE